MHFNKNHYFPLDMVYDRFILQYVYDKICNQIYFHKYYEQVLTSCTLTDLTDISATTERSQ